jgi:hypothetical protein
MQRQRISAEFIIVLQLLSKFFLYPNKSIGVAFDESVFFWHYSTYIIVIKNAKNHPFPAYLF